MRVALIAVLGAAGALSRYGIGQALGERDVPVATLLINVTGSFLLGLLVSWGATRFGGDVRAALGIGFLGAYTTFSTFTVDATLLTDDGRAGVATAYVLVSIGLGLAAAAGGIALGRALVR